MQIPRAKFGRAAVLLGSVGLAPFVAGQNTLQEFVHDLESARNSFPACSAPFTETVVVTGTEMPLQTGSTSWGGRNGIREFVNSVNGGAIRYETKSHFGNTPSQLPPMPRSYYRDTKGVTSIDILSRSGEIEKDQDFPFPLGFCYWVNGRPIDHLVKELESPVVDDQESTRLITGTLQGVPIEFTFSKGSVPALLRLDIGRGDAVWALNRSETVSDHKIATSVSCIIHSRNPIFSGTARHEFEIKGSVEFGEKDIALHWIDGMRVYDRVNDRILRVRDGRLTGDPLFEKSVRKDTSRRFVYFMVGGTTILIAGIATLRKLRAKTRVV